ncbi:hypothetical protein ACHAWX_000939 [Stephanocyclus meneghinianus]
MFESSFVFITGTLNSLRTNSRRNRHATKVITKETWLLANYDPVVQRDKLFDELMLVSTFLASLAHPTPSQAIEPQLASPNHFEIQDANTYSAVVYIPPPKKHKSQRTDGDSLPLILLLHGAGINQHSALYEFTLLDLPPPASLNENFVVVAPYVGKGKQGSLYDEPRGKVLAFLKWFRRWVEENNSIIINPQKVSLFGFSEGATLAVELGTTRMFNALILASYGFTGTLPTLAIERLQGIPMWIFHSIGDDVYNIECSNRLAESLLSYQSGTDIFSVGDRIKFTKLKPVERPTAATRISDSGSIEHVRSALRASSSEDVYSWLLRQ